MSGAGFEAALRRLVTDEEFADSVAADPNKLLDVYKVSEDEQNVLNTIFQTINPGSGAGINIACYAKCA